MNELNGLRSNHNGTSMGGNNSELIARAILLAQQQRVQSAPVVTNQATTMGSHLHGAAAASWSGNPSSDRSATDANNAFQAILPFLAIAGHHRSASAATSSDSGDNNENYGKQPHLVSNSSTSSGENNVKRRFDQGEATAQVEIPPALSPAASAALLSQPLANSTGSAQAVPPQQRLEQIQRNTRQLQQLARMQQFQPPKQQQQQPQQVQQLQPLFQQQQQFLPQPAGQQQLQQSNVNDAGTRELTQALARVIESRLRELSSRAQQQQGPGPPVQQQGNSSGDTLAQSLVVVASLLGNKAHQVVSSPQQQQPVAAAQELRHSDPQIPRSIQFPAPAAAAESRNKKKIKSKSGKCRTGTFPQKLHQMLMDLEQQDQMHIASFMDQGKAFCIHRPQDFVEEVMPRYFKMSTYASFQRQLNLYDFVRINEGLARGAYHHPLFIKGQPLLSATMKRSKTKGLTSMQYAQKLHDEQQARERAQREHSVQQQLQQQILTPQPTPNISGANWSSVFQRGAL